MPIDLAAQVKLVAAGDADALQRLVIHHDAGLRGVVTGAIDAAMRSRIDPDDILQEAYIVAFKSLGDAEFNSPEHFQNWLKRIALDRLKDAQRAQRRQKRDVAREAHEHAASTGSYPDLVHRLAGGESTPSRQIAKAEAIAAVMSSLARLTDDQREVVRLRFLQDVPVAEIAKRLGKTETAVYTLCHRGLKSLRGLMVSITRYLSRL
ncbi:MAG: sigma-70 family RNA polymerase sigma factor [Planctomycetes bacterium]|nr:sigma-70 family RNA polymerase sigma factor [Planctomycetota bacterium]